MPVHDTPTSRETATSSKTTMSRDTAIEILVRLHTALLALRAAHVCAAEAEEEADMIALSIHRVQQVMQRCYAAGGKPWRAEP